jgi:CheY-like chemotaxis protein
MSALPYYHPTTIVAVDDSELFSLDVELRLPPVLAFESYSDPQDALDRVNQNASAISLLQRCLRRTRPTGSYVSMDWADIQDEVARHRRFQRVTVVVADYAMPAMSGVELCSEIVDPLIRKILITGVGDQRTTMKALNDGEIDRYLVKGDRRMFPKLISYIRELQQEYFLEEQENLESACTLKVPPYALDRAFVKYFEVLRRSLNIVEYYILSETAGIMMMTADGDMLRLEFLGQCPSHDSAPEQTNSDVIRLRNIRSMREFVRDPLIQGRRASALNSVIQIEGEQGWLFRIRGGECLTGATQQIQASYSSYLAQIDAERARATA